jgi:hypothetical protein
VGGVTRDNQISVSLLIHTFFPEITKNRPESHPRSRGKGHEKLPNFSLF